MAAHLQQRIKLYEIHLNNNEKITDASIPDIISIIKATGIENISVNVTGIKDDFVIFFYLTKNKLVNGAEQISFVGRFAMFLFFSTMQTLFVFFNQIF